MSRNNETTRLGVLTYDLQPFCQDLLARLQNALPAVKVTAYPCFYHPAQALSPCAFLESSIRPKPLGVHAAETQEAFTSSINFRAAWRLAADNDILMLYGLQGATALLVALFGSLRRRRIISVNHSLAPAMERRRRWWVLAAKRFLLGACDWHICQMPAAEQTLAEVYRLPLDRMSFAPFEGGASLYRPLTANRQQRRLASRSRFGCGPEDVLYLFVGNIIPLKGPDLFIRALATLDSRCVGVLAGPEEPGYGPAGTLAHYRDLAHSLGAGSRIHLTGRLDSDGLADLYASADVFVLPTYKDCMPKVFIEAALFGLPIITTVAPGSVGVLPDPGRNGFAVPIGDVEALAGAMSELVGLQKRAAFSKASLSAVNAFCDPVREVKGFVDAVEKTMRRGSIPVDAR